MTEPEPKPKPDPFDPERFRLSQDFLNQAGTKKMLRVPVRRPHPQEFVRVHPELRLTPTAIVDLKEDRMQFLVASHMLQELPGEYHTASIFLGMTRQQNPFLWPVRLKESDGKYSDWHRSAMEAAELAMSQWVKLKADMSAGSYQVYVATAEGLPEPRWPEEAFEEILRVAFPADRIIDRVDHPVIRKLRGEV